MNDLFDRVTGEQDFFKKLLSKVPGFKGYIERENRRSADKLLRETLADRFELLWQRISSLQTDLVNQGEIKHIDDVERGAIKIRQFIDRIRTAAYGYAGLFDAIKVNEAELAHVYQYDLALLNAADEVGRAVDHIEVSIGTDGLPAAIRNLVSISQSCVDALNKRTEVILGSYGAGPVSDATPAATGTTQPPAEPPSFPPSDLPNPPSTAVNEEEPPSSTPTIP